MRRAFVCLRPSEAICDRLSDVGEDLLEGRAVPHDDLHLTLAFLGDQPMPVLEEIALGLKRAADAAAGAMIEATGVGVFGDRRPRSAHARVAPCAALSSLRARVRRAAEDAGVALPRDRFTPHVTLVRFGERAGRAGPDLPRWLAEHAGLRAGPAPAGPLRLWSSRLTEGGAIYEEMFAAAPG